MATCGLLLVLVNLSCGAEGAEKQPAVARIAILGGMPPLSDNVDALDIAAMLKREGHDAVVVSPVQLTDVSFVNASRYSVLILPHSDLFPEQALHNLETFLKQKGKLLCLDGPPLTRLLYADGRQWLTRHNLLTRLPATTMAELRWDGKSAWSSAGDDPASKATLTLEPSPAGEALHVRIDGYKSWFNLGPAKLQHSPFVPGSVVTSFWARGDSSTDALVMEWDEADGSRWIASSPLSTEWQRVALMPSEFHYWPDSKGSGRGGPKDHLNPAAATVWRIGLAQSHAPQPPGTHQFWIAAMGSAALPLGMGTEEPNPLVLEGISPLHKLVHDTVTGAWLPMLRDRGIGISGKRTGRLMPINLSTPAYPTAVSEYSEWLRICLDGPFTGAVWGAIALPRHEGGHLVSDIRPIVRAMLQNTWFVCAGAEIPAAVTGKPVTVGADLVNVGPRAASMYLREILEPSPPDAGKPTIVREGAIEIPAGERLQVRRFADFTAPVPGVYRYRALLQSTKGGLVLDRIEMPVRIVKSGIRSDLPGTRVTVSGGEFVLGGQPFRPIGVNFWPLSVAGQEPATYQRGWLSPEQYDPDVIEQDLTRCEAAGINLVSIQYLRSDQGPSVIDFTARCRNHHILVNVFVADADPRNLDVSRLNGLLDSAQLTNSPDVFAFDVAWEPHLGKHTDRTRYDREWRAWIDVNYGGITAAEADWGLKAPRDAAGELTNPDDLQVSSDGPWRIMTAAYRRFVDEMLGQGYRSVVQALKPRGALVGARSGYGGNGFPGVDPEMPFDLVSGAAHLDFISPEGYGLTGEWPEFRAGGFTAAYARWAGNGKPVFWAEFGASIFPGGDQDQPRLKMQADVMDKMYRMVVDSGSNGSSVWWLPGGLRIDENSDFGIFNPDGTMRPAARRIRSHADKELPGASVAVPATATLTGDRDLDARGFTGINLALRAEYAKMREAGKFPAFEPLPTQTTSANVPLVAVGNVPANGHNPLKYIGAEIFIDPALPDQLVLLNTGDCSWSSEGAGRVVLTVTKAGTSKPIEIAMPRHLARYERFTVSAAAIRNSLNGDVAGARLRMAIKGRKDAPGGLDLLAFGEQKTGL